MPNRTARRSPHTWVFLAGFALPLVLAGHLPSKEGQRTAAGFWLGAWHSLTCIWDKNGAQADPNGQPLASPSAPEPAAPAGASTLGDNGAVVDPSGRR